MPVDTSNTAPDLGHASPELELTILMPCLNEARTVASCVRKASDFLRLHNIHGEVVVADNGSNDGSQQLASESGARVINVADRGYGAALIGGIHAAHGTFVIMGDADLSYDFSELLGFVSKLRDGADLVMGDRFAGGIRQGAMPFLHRYLGNPVLSFIGRLFFTSNIRDFHCGLRGFRRDAILALRLRSPGMEFASEMIVKATLNNLLIAQVPVVLHPDERGRAPHLRTWRDGWRHLRFLCLHAPAWLFLYPGLILIFSGVLGAGSLVSGARTVLGASFDIHTMLFLAAATIVGMQLVIFSALSTFHAHRIGVLPRLPLQFAWLEHVSLEKALIFGLIVFSLGIALSVYSVVSWGQVGFAQMDPRSLMRSVIPAVTTIIAGADIAIAGIFLEFLRMADSDSQNKST